MLVKKKYTVLDTLIICFKCNPVSCCGVFILVIIGALLPSALLIFNSRFIDSALSYVAMKKNFNVVLVNILKITIVLAIIYFYTILIRIMKEKINIGLRAKFYKQVVERTVYLKYEYIENGETCDLMNRIINWPGLPTIENAFDHMINVVSHAIYILGLTGTIWSTSWWLIPISFIGAIPLLIGSYFMSKEIYIKVRWNSELARKSDYIEFNVLRGRELAAERSLFQYSNYFNNQFESYFMKSVNIEADVRRKWLILNKIFTAIVVTICIASTFILLDYLQQEKITLGVFISLVTVLFQLENMMSEQIPDLICSLTEDQEYMNDFTKFMELEEECIDNEEYPEQMENIQTLEFKNVFFKYPGTDRYILNGISFTLHKGKHYAIVGKNGSGKSTLTKLMLGLYDINKGEILINGKNLNEFKKGQIYSFFSIVYQDFAQYAIKIRDNIGIGNLKEMDNMDKINVAAENAGIKTVIDKLEKGMDTSLGKVLDDGIDFSGGQWQRIAIARSLMRDNTLRILDEPTSALDPLEESRLYKQYAEISKDSTTVFISHRLGSTKLADEILVIDNGKLIAQGNHEDLMQDCELYKTMFNTQREWYHGK